MNYSVLQGTRNRLLVKATRKAKRKLPTRWDYYYQYISVFVGVAVRQPSDRYSFPNAACGRNQNVDSRKLNVMYKEALSYFVGDAVPYDPWDF